MSRYKVGDRVVVKELESGREYDGLTVNKSITDMEGRVLTVSKIHKNGIHFDVYESFWIFNDSMVMPYAEHKTSSITVGVTVNISKKLKALDGIKEALNK